MLRDRMERLEARLRAAARRAGRHREEIALLAVTKTFPAEVIAESYALGLRDFGENYVQEFEAKVLPAALPGARFHLIGHLQANKSNRAAELFDRDDYGADYMRDTCPWDKMSPEQCNALFTRMGDLLDDVFGYARRLGIQTSIGRFPGRFAGEQLGHIGFRAACLACIEFLRQGPGINQHPLAIWEFN